MDAWNTQIGPKKPGEVIHITSSPLSPARTSRRCAILAVESSWWKEALFVAEILRKYPKYLGCSVTKRYVDHQQYDIFCFFGGALLLNFHLPP